MRRTSLAQCLTLLTLSVAAGCSDSPPAVLTSDVVVTNDFAPVDASMSCGPREIVCGLSCVNAATSVEHCGTCGRRCGAGEVCASGMCLAGSDGGACAAAMVRCGDRCIDVASDVTNCGACGRSCAVDESCASGVCVSASRPDASMPPGPDVQGGVDVTSREDVVTVPMDAFVPCPDLLVRCGAACADLSSSTQHCGGCDRPCAAGASCRSGACVAPVVDSGVTPPVDAGPPPCTGAQIRCGGVCTDLSASAQHCGGCGRPCAAGSTCQGGTCVAAVVDSGVAPVDSGVTACPGSQVRCGAACFDLSTSLQHCGGCNRPCAAGLSCLAGACVGIVDASVLDSGVACPAGQLRCDGACVDVAASAAHCGGCGMACPAGSTCVSGTCRAPTVDAGMGCAAGQLRCDGMCINPASDQSHCGGCNNRCVGDTACVGGTCRSTMMQPDAGGACGAGFITCNGVCANPATDQSNCGGCNRPCVGSTTCMGGTCVSTMTMGLPDAGTCGAGQIMCSGMCANPATNQSHCGGCDRRCEGNTACMSGTCVSTMNMGDSGPPMDAGGGSMCAPGQTLCSGVCRDLRFERNNCGSCGRACPTGNYCMNGTCMAETGPMDGGTGDAPGGSMCAPGQTLCSGVCRDLNYDSNNCGSCGRACTGGGYCDRGVCMSGVSTDGGSPDSATPDCTLCPGVQGCVDVRWDPGHCGACGRVCGAGQLCIMSSCVTTTTCPSPGTLCSGRCVVLQGDDSNCGRCGNACPAGRTCRMGTCQ